MTQILSSNQTHALHHTFFAPVGDVKATLTILHGMAEHSGRYTEFAQFLTKQGIAVVTYDHLGHGKTAQATDELGFIGLDNPMQLLIDDAMIMANALHDKYPNVAHFIMGHSMGSFITRNLLNQHPKNFTGAILMGTGDKDPLVKRFISPLRAFNKVSPNRPNKVGYWFMNKLLNTKLSKRRLKSPFAWLSVDESNITAYEADPLCGFTFTNNGYYTLLNLVDRAVNQQWYNKLYTDFPLMIVSGEDDPIGNMGKGIDNLVKDLNKVGFDQINKILYADMRHEILHETDKQTVYNDISKWLLSLAK